MSKLSKDKRDKLIMVGLGTGGVLAALNFFLIGGQQTELANTEAKIATVENNVRKAESLVRESNYRREEFNAKLAKLKIKEDEMAPVDKYRWIFSEILDPFLAGSRVQLIDVSREPEIGDIGLLPNFPYKGATFGVKLYAEYHDLGKFLADFENNFPYMRVLNLKMTPDKPTMMRGPGATNVLGAVPPVGTTAGRFAQTEKLNAEMKIVTLVKPVP